MASDSTVLSPHGGSVTAHTVYATLANIDKSVRSWTSENTWILVAYIPKSKFENTMVAYEHKPKKERARIKALLNR